MFDAARLRWRWLTCRLGLAAGAGSMLLGLVVTPVAAAGAGDPAGAAVASAAATGACASTTASGARCLVNRGRAAAGLRRLRADGRLARAARRQARDMVARGYFAHQRPGGPDLGRRLRSAHWRGTVGEEAIAYGCGASAGAGATVAAWLASPPHRAILLARQADRVGISVQPGSPSACPGGATWVLEAGAR
jgi:uncharacterized protein YkwD